MDTLTLRWLGHACFQMIYKGYTVVFDPFEDDYVPGFGWLDAAADLVLCSHDHHDHGAAYAIDPLEGHENPFRITGIETFHDPKGGALRGRNTIHLLESEDGLRVAHFGDIGCELTPEQKETLKGLDVAMIPVGGFYTIGPGEAKQLIDELQPRVAVPMHYRLGELGFPILAELGDFLDLVGRHRNSPGNTIEIDGNTPKQVAVPTFQPHP